MLFFSALIRSTIGFWRCVDCNAAAGFVGAATNCFTGCSIFGCGDLYDHVGVELAEGRFTVNQALVLSSLVGIPVGLFLLANLPEVYVKALLGVILILFGVYKPGKARFTGDTLQSVDLYHGFSGGHSGGAYNSNGPPIIVYGNWRAGRRNDFVLPCNPISYRPVCLFFSDMV